MPKFQFLYRIPQDLVLSLKAPVSDTSNYPLVLIPILIKDNWGLYGVLVCPELQEWPPRYVNISIYIYICMLYLHTYIYIYIYVLYIYIHIRAYMHTDATNTCSQTYKCEELLPVFANLNTTIKVMTATAISKMLSSLVNSWNT